MTRKSLLNGVILAVVGCSNSSCGLSCHQALIDEIVQRQGSKNSWIDDVGSCYPLAKNIEVILGTCREFASAVDWNHVPRRQVLEKVLWSGEVLTLTRQTCKAICCCRPTEKLFGRTNGRLQDELKPLLLSPLRDRQVRVGARVNNSSDTVR